MLELLLISLGYVSMAATIEAIMYSRTGAEAFKKINEHIFIVFASFFFVFGISYAATFAHMNFTESLVYAATCSLSYPFWHDGIYYEVARRINRPDYRFNSNSKTSTAKIEIPWFVRGNMFILALIILLVYKYIL